MVTESILTDKVLRSLEKFIIAKSGFRLIGENKYNLVLLIPSDRFDFETKHSLIVSSKSFDHLDSTALIRELLLFLKTSLTTNEYKAISRISIIRSTDSFVKAFGSFMFQSKPIIEIQDVVIGGITIDYGFVLNSTLEKLVENRAVTIIDVSGNSLNAGIKGIDHNFNILYYTEKGLREMWRNTEMSEEERENAKKLKQKGDDYLLEHGYLAIISFDQIERVV